MRVLFYYTHKQTLGHTTRSFSLAKKLSDSGAEVFILQGGVPQACVQAPQTCVVRNVPLPFDDRSSFHSLKQPISADQRGDFILKTAQEFEPDVLITEFFPFGRSSYTPELLPVLRYLRKKCARIMASIGYPLIADLNNFENKTTALLKHAIFSFFDTFLIHTPFELETPYFKKSIQSETLSSLYDSIMNDLKSRIVYTGYIFPDKIISGGAQVVLNGNPEETIVVSRGGGSVYPKLIACAIDAHCHLKNSTHTIIACGPATSLKEMEFFQSRLKAQDQEHIFLAGHLNNLHDYLRTCQVSVNLGGYNTSVQLMYYGTPSIIVPYHSKNSKSPINDQIARALLLKEKFSSIVLDCHTLTGETLAAAIKEQMQRPRPTPAPADWFKGADAAARVVLGETLN